MRVRGLFFGMLKEWAGTASDLIEVGEGAAVRDVLRHYESRIPQLPAALASLALAVNQQYASPETSLKPGDEVALLPPVSGGSVEAAGETLAGGRRYGVLL